MKTRTFPENEYPLITYLKGLSKDPLDLSRVLDYGCGDGNFLRTARAYELADMKVYRGVDVDEGALSWFTSNRSQWSSLPTGLDFEVKADPNVYSPVYNPKGMLEVSEAYLDPSMTYTAIICYSVLSHLHLRNASATMTRLLKNLAVGGRAFFSFCETSEPSTLAWFIRRRLETYGSVKLKPNTSLRFNEFYLVNNEFRDAPSFGPGEDINHFVSFFPLSAMTRDLNYLEFETKFATVRGWPQTCLIVKRVAPSRSLT
jgi:SAM-dependent methyltransferase